MAKKELNTSIQIAASPEKIWNVLMDFDSYPSWNSFITSISGHPKVGGHLNITAGNMKFKPEIVSLIKNNELSWKGKLWIRGLFDGLHIFRIIDNKNGTCTFEHSEKFSGILIGLFSKKLDVETREGFEDMNQKLKERVENNN